MTIPETRENLGAKAVQLREQMRPARLPSAGFVVFVAVFILICVKSVILIGFLANGDPSDYDLGRGWNSVPSVPVYLSFVTATLAFAFLFKGRARLWYLLSYDVFFSLLFVADLMKYRAYASFMTPFMLIQIGNLENLGSCLASLLRPPDVIFVADIPVIFLLVIVLIQRMPDSRRSLPLFLALLVLSGSTLAYFNSGRNHQDANFRSIFEVSWLPSKNFKELSPIGYHLFDSYVFFYETRALSLSSDQEELISQWFLSNAEHLPDNEYQGIFTGCNLLIIHVEALENFVIGAEIEGQKITPNLNRLLNNSLYFPRYVEQVSGGLSSDSYLLTNTSVYPVRSGATFFRYPNNQYNSLPVMLGELGYSSLAVHPVRGSYWNWLPASRAIGFDIMLDSSCWNIEESFGLGISDGCYFPQVIEKLALEEPPFYAFMVTLSTHAPFQLPPEHQELQLPPNLESTRLGDYFQAVNYTDRHLGIFLEYLDNRGILDNTAVVICGDHCGVHSFYNDEVQLIEPAQDWWLDNHHRIPLLIYHKNLEGRYFEVNGGQIDLLPTVAYLMGIDEDKYLYTAMGRNLLKTTRDYAIVSPEVFYGDTADQAQLEHAFQGLEVADLVIRSNYFSWCEND